MKGSSIVHRHFDFANNLIMFLHGTLGKEDFAWSYLHDVNKVLTTHASVPALEVMTLFGGARREGDKTGKILERKVSLGGGLVVKMGTSKGIFFFK